jgi:hypothetical protein
VSEHPRRCLGLVHLPKCGGTALRTAFTHVAGCYTGPVYFDRQHFGTNRLADGVPVQTRHVIGSLEDVRHIVDTHRLVMGHISAHMLVSAGCDSLALQVREPRARILSLYSFWRAQEDDERSRWGLWGSQLIGQADQPFQAFLATPSIWPAVANSMTRQLCGKGTGTRARWASGPRSPFALTRRYRAIRPWLGIVEWSNRSDVFVERIMEAIGSDTVPELARENVAHPSGDTQVIDRSTHERLRRLTVADSLLLHRLAADGLLERREAGELDEEFEREAERLNFRLQVPAGAP